MLKTFHRSARLWLTWLLPAALCAPLAVHACTTAYGGLNVNDSLTLANETQPDRVLQSWREATAVGSNANFTGCTAGRSTGMLFSVTSPGNLTFVRTVQVAGVSYRAYGTHSTSPLFIFRVHPFATNYSNSPTALGLAGSTLFSGTPGHGGFMFITWQYAVVSRGGYMTDADTGSVEGVVGTFPGTVSTPPIGLGVRVSFPALTCTLSNASLTLDPVAGRNLLTPGDTSTTTPLSVSMNCPSAGIPVTLSLVDANTAPGAPGELAPDRTSTAGGVHVRLLRNNAPVALRTSWNHGASQAGNQRIDLTAQYIRTSAALKPGNLRSQAILTATYR